MISAALPPPMRRLRVVMLGLSITSSWGNGHATLWRALCRALAAPLMLAEATQQPVNKLTNRSVRATSMINHGVPNRAAANSPAIKRLDDLLLC